MELSLSLIDVEAEITANKENYYCKVFAGEDLIGKLPYTRTLKLTLHNIIPNVQQPITYTLKLYNCETYIGEVTLDWNSSQSIYTPLWITVDNENP